LQPAGKHSALRGSPIKGVLLTNPDLDHCLGLVMMRQQTSPLIVYATETTRSALDWIDIILQPFCQIEWRTPAADFQSLDKQITYRAIALATSVAFQLRDQISDTIVLFAPAVREITTELRDASHTSDVVLFDGTFWSDDELRRVRPGARRARAMNHLPISDGSFDFLRHSPARRKIYTHINNTNPVFIPGSSERVQIENAGIEIAYDGLEIVV
jgi:pyrroloquinoline quinone biosynthesis protein B